MLIKCDFNIKTRILETINLVNINKLNLCKLMIVHYIY
jgi:hypothetical protein